MSSPGTRSRDNKPAAGPNGKKRSEQTWRVLSEDGVARASPSIAMPRAKTELSELLAGDSELCIRRRPTVAAELHKAGPHREASGIPAKAQTASSAEPAIDPELASVIDAWPGLPRNVRAAVLAMVHREPQNQEEA